jgi:serine/threonine protein kinase
MYSRIVADKAIEFPPSVDRTTKDLITNLLLRDPDRRLNEKKVMNHPYFSGVNWQELVNLHYPAPFRPGLVHLC